MNLNARQRTLTGRRLGMACWLLLAISLTVQARTKEEVWNCLKGLG